MTKHYLKWLRELDAAFRAKRYDEVSTLIEWAKFDPDRVFHKTIDCSELFSYKKMRDSALKTLDLLERYGTCDAGLQDSAQKLEK